MASIKNFSRRTSILLKTRCYLHTDSGYAKWPSKTLCLGDTQAIHPSRWDVYLIEVKYCDDTRPEQQLARTTEQHIGLKHALAQQCHKVSHTYTYHPDWSDGDHL